MHLNLGKLYIEAFGSYRRIGPVWCPDSLHVWWGGTGVHFSLFDSPRVERDRLAVHELV
jgi:hypothetical protein